MDAKDAIAGVWYQHNKYGKVLCCGRRGLEYFNGFVIHREYETSLRFLRDLEVVTKSLNQSWGDEPSRPIAGESTAKNVNESVALADRLAEVMVGESLKEFSDSLEAEAKQSTGNGSQLESGSSPELTDIGLRVDQHGNVVFRPELVEKTL